MELKPTDREAELVEVRWQQRPAMVTEARERFADDLAHSTLDAGVR